MASLPNEALVVRGGENKPNNFTDGSGVLTGATGLLSEVSVQCASGKTELELSRRLLNGQVGVTTMGKNREAGGEVKPDPKPGNPDHCLLFSLDAVTASQLFTPAIANPYRAKVE